MPVLTDRNCSQKYRYNFVIIPRFAIAVKLKGDRKTPPFGFTLSYRLVSALPAQLESTSQQFELRQIVTAAKA
jgi:hypothetical protein